MASDVITPYNFRFALKFHTIRVSPDKSGRTVGFDSMYFININKDWRLICWVKLN
jgi:hypothetical protein